MECQQHKQKQDEQQQRKTAVKRVKLPKGTPTASPFTSLSPFVGLHSHERSLQKRRK